VLCARGFNRLCGTVFVVLTTNSTSAVCEEFARSLIYENYIDRVCRVEIDGLKLKDVR